MIEPEAPALPYSKWLENAIDNAIKRCMTGTGRWGTTFDYLVMRSMIGYYSRDHDHIIEHGIAHGDMHAHNIMVDERLELTGCVSENYHPRSIIDLSHYNNTVPVLLTGTGHLRLLYQP